MPSWPTYPGTDRVVLGCAARQGPGETYGQRWMRQRRTLVELVELIANQRAIGTAPWRTLEDVARRAARAIEDVDRG